MQTNVPWRAVLRRNVDIPRQPCKAAMLISVNMYSDFSGCLLPAQRKSCLMLVTWQPSDWGTLGRDWNSPSSVPAGHQPLNSRHFCPLVPTFADVSMDNDLMFSAIAAKSWKRHVKLYIYVYIPRASNVWLFFVRPNISCRTNYYWSQPKTRNFWSFMWIAKKQLSNRCAQALFPSFPLCLCSWPLFFRSALNIAFNGLWNSCDLHNVCETIPRHAFRI